MALGFTNRGSGYGYGDDQSFGDTFTPTEGNMLLVATSDWSNDITAINGFSITFSLIESLAISGTRTLNIFAGEVGASPGSGQLSFTSNTATSYECMCVEVSGVDLSSGVAAAFVQVREEAQYFTSTTLDQIGTNMSSYGSGNECLIFQCDPNGNGASQTPTSTSLQHSASGQYFIGLYHYAGEITQPDYAPNAAYIDHGAIAFEIAVASEGTAVEVNLTGVSAAGQIGTLLSAAGAGVDLTGVQSAGQVGNFTLSTAATIELTGVSAAGQAGDLSLSAVVTLALTGVQSIGEVGTLTAGESTAVEVNLTGVSAAGQVGTLSAAASVALDLLGVEASSVVGVFDISAHVTQSLDGAETTSQVGSLSIIVGGKNYVIPSARTYIVQADDKTLLVIADDKTLSVSAEQNKHKVH